MKKIDSYITVRKTPYFLEIILYDGENYERQVAPTNDQEIEAARAMAEKHGLKLLDFYIDGMNPTLIFPIRK